MKQLHELRSLKDARIREANQLMLRYLNSLPPEKRDVLARELDTSQSYLRKAASRGELLREKICSELERISRRKVTRQMLRPYDWETIWPELREAKAA